MDNVFLSQGRSLSFKTFLIWVLISVYQGKATKLTKIVYIFELSNVSLPLLCKLYSAQNLTVGCQQLG